MFSIDLRWAGFGLFLLLMVLPLVAVWWDRRSITRRVAPAGAEGLGEVLERAPFGWLMLVGARGYRYANPYARRLLDLSDPTGTLPETQWSALLAADRLDARERSTGTGCYRTTALSPERTVRWWVAPCGERDVAFLLDVTAQKQTEQAATYLLSGLSHELRTPLAAIMTHLEVLYLPDVPEETREQSLRLLKSETKRMARLINLMLALGRLETSTEIEQRPVDLLDLVERALAHAGPQAEEKGLTISLQADTPLPLVRGDADRLMQVFLNLLDNVVKHCRPGDRAEVSLQVVSEGLACVVRDTGPGIPEKHLSHITRRFYRAVPQSVEGSGLGLALVEEIVRRHDSRLEIESRTGGQAHGTRVRLVLPVFDETGRGA